MRRIHARFHPLQFVLDRGFLIVSCDGDLARYGVEQLLSIGSDLRSWLPCLYGIEPGVDIEFPMVNVIDGMAVDVCLQWCGERAEVLILDASVGLVAQMEMQQLANDVSLLNGRLADMTERLQRQNAALDEANLAKGKFIAGMSHEFRTPILSMMGQLSLMARQDSAGEFSGALRNIESGAHYLLNLIDNLLQQGALDLGRLVVNRQPVRMRQFVALLVEIFQPLADEKGLQLEVENALPDDIELLLDAQRLRQVLVNLLGNAIKFTAQGSVCLSLCIEGGRLVIGVTDTGCGIPEGDVANLFEPFQRAGNVGGTSGAGLGLSISREIVNAMHGELLIESRVGTGTRVRVSLHASSSVPQIDSRTVSTGRQRLFVLDDTPSILAIYELFLGEAGFDVVSFSRQEALFVALGSGSPDLIVLDLNLTDGSGFEVASQLREAGYIGKIIILTATFAVDEATVATALSHGADSIDVKPLDAEQLVTTVMAALG